MRTGLARLDLVAIAGIAGLIALLAVPLVMAGERTYNERQAVTALKMMTTAEADFRSNDRDGNRTMDFWTADVYGLYGMVGITGSSTVPPLDTADAKNIIGLLPRSVAAADGRTDHTLYGNLEFSSAFDSGGRIRRGYFFRALHNEVTGGTATTLLNDTDGASQFYLACHDNDRFAYAAFPASSKTGSLIFIVNEDNTLWQIKIPGTYTATFTGATGAASDSTSSVSGEGLAAEVTMSADIEQGTFPAAPAGLGFSKVNNDRIPDFGKRLEKAEKSLAAAIERAMKEAKDGVVVTAALEEEDGRVYYAVDVAQKDKVLDVRVDAKDGTVLSKAVEYENWSDPAKGAKSTALKAIELAEKKTSGKAVGVRLRWSRDEATFHVPLWKDGRLSLATVDGEDVEVR